MGINRFNAQLRVEAPAAPAPEPVATVVEEVKPVEVKSPVEEKKVEKKVVEKKVVEKKQEE